MDNNSNIENYSLKKDECVKFDSFIEKFGNSLALEKNYSEHTIRNYKNEMYTA